MRHLPSWFTTPLAIAFFSAAAACEGSVQIDDSSSGGSGGASASSVATNSATTGKGTTVAASSTSVSTVSSSGAGGTSAVCELMKHVYISNVVLVDAGGDQVWSPGETASMQVQMMNESFADNTYYPGFEVESDVAGIASSGNTLFGLLGAQTVQVPFDVTSDGSIAPGTDVTLTLTVTSLNEPCPDLDSVSATFTLQ